MKARKIKRRRPALRSDVNRLEDDNEDLQQTLGECRITLKQMCDLCDKQCEEIDSLKAHIRAHTDESIHLNALIRLLVKGASA